MSLQALTAISNEYGSNPEFVLAGGGNTSFKTDRHLFIKGSGCSLADITESGFVKMNRRRLAVLWQKQYPDDPAEREKEVLSDLMNAREEGEDHKRPSVETSLHDLLPQKFVVHTHPSLVNGLTCSQNGKINTDDIFQGKALWIPCTTPGYILASVVKREIEQYMDKKGVPPQVILLENHGLFVAADSIEEIRSITKDVMEKINQRIRRRPDFSSVPFDVERAAAMAPAIRMLLMGQQETSIVTFRINHELAELLKSPESFLSVSSAYSPDHIVYCRHEPLFVPFRKDLKDQYRQLKEGYADYVQRNNLPPRIIAVENLGIFAGGQNIKEADTAASVFMDAVKISVYAESFGGHKFMPSSLIEFVLHWEVETYRAKMSLMNDVHKRLKEKIVIVTGAAQGFGRGIAEEMAKEGAIVIIADLNDKKALENASHLCSLYGQNRAAAVKVNVVEEDSVRNMIVETVLKYGGLDVFVSNAGVLKAGSLEDMDLNTFEFVTKVNYTGYYLCCRYASVPMKIQHNFKKDYFMDIIQINSKSGLEGSNKNFAYAGSKFGGLGLTQSFALELVPYNIKVNAVCPGNFFEGPLWSDPENGLFVQYLEAGKVPGAKTVEDVKKFYESKVPMGRGCRVLDVARAVFYIIEQKYETGQAIPVTGGQVMLS